jgi:ATP-dependent RNA helicase DHX8/PRP22
LSSHLNPSDPSDSRGGQQRSARNPDRPTAGSGSNSTPLGGGPPVEEQADDMRRKTLKRLTSPERFEITQLIASGVLKSSDYPALNQEDRGDGMNYEPTEEAFDIEITQVL